MALPRLASNNPAQERPPLLVIAYYYPPDTASGAARPHRLAKYLSRIGHDTSVISMFTGAGPRDEPGVHRVRSEGEGAERTGYSGLLERCLRKAVFNHDPGVIWVPRVVSRASALYRGRQRPVVLSSAPPLTTHLAGLWLKLRHGWPWIADCRDPLSGNPFRMSPATMRTDPFFERLMFRHADVVIANTSSVAAMWASRHPRWKHKIHVIWNGFDPESTLKALPISTTGPRRLRHVGTIYGDRDPLPVVSAVHSLVQSGQIKSGEISVDLYGPLVLNTEDEMAKLNGFAKQGWLRIRNAQIPKVEAAELTATTDYLLLLDVLGSKAGLQVPAKLFEYISIGRPILASTTPGSPVADILAKSGVRHLCYDGNWTDSAERRMIEFLSLPSDPVQPSEWYQTTFNAVNQAAIISRLAVGLAGP